MRIQTRKMLLRTQPQSSDNIDWKKAMAWKVEKDFFCFGLYFSMARHASTITSHQGKARRAPSSSLSESFGRHMAKTPPWDSRGLSSQRSICLSAFQNDFF